ncbi:unnamed protein product [Vicia faba]|uniref:Uncharacterized protein n=1 Tax=Vicia faba TaxID=3906 RepID=A0AAV0ZIY5_VICFA|nr:unnamed protein product [Vicia faba]
MDALLRCMIFLVLFHALLVNPCYCFKRNSFNVSHLENKEEDNKWRTGKATHYGPPKGAGSTGGACGYGDTVEKHPFNKMISAGGGSIYRNGKGCGSCYKVKCTENKECSGKSVRVVISDECGGCGEGHFDLSCTSFESLAKKGQDHGKNLIDAGMIKIEYKRIACNFWRTIAFETDKGANPFHFIVQIQYQNGYGDIEKVELKEQGSKKWHPMQHSWGARWFLSIGKELNPPYSIRLTQTGNGKSKTIKARKVIPKSWKPGKVYWSQSNL